MQQAGKAGDVMMKVRRADTQNSLWVQSLGQTGCSKCGLANVQCIRMVSEAKGASCSLQGL